MRFGLSTQAAQRLGRIAVGGAVALLVAVTAAAPVGALNRSEALALVNRRLDNCFSSGGESIVFEWYGGFVVGCAHDLTIDVITTVRVYQYDEEDSALAEGHEEFGALDEGRLEALVSSAMTDGEPLDQARFEDLLHQAMTAGAPPSAAPAEPSTAPGGNDASDSRDQDQDKDKDKDKGKRAHKHQENKSQPSKHEHGHRK
jgi:hypothetical protein